MFHMVKGPNAGIKRGRRREEREGGDHMKWTGERETERETVWAARNDASETQH